MTCNHDCFNCIYKDCINNELTEEDYTESDKLEEDVQRVIRLYYGWKKEKRSPREQGKPRDRHDYNKRYYQEHKEEIKLFMRATYDKEQNARKCKEYAKKNKDRLKDYHKSYYQKNKEKIKEKARKNYYKRLEMTAHE